MFEGCWLWMVGLDEDDDGDDDDKGSDLWQNLFFERVQKKTDRSEFPRKDENEI